MGSTLQMQITREILRAALDLPAWSRPFGTEGVRAAAVAIPIHLGVEPAATLVLRSSSLREHAGEVGFPGGKQDPGDADLQATALRELKEEVDLGADDVEMFGRLAPVAVITRRYRIHPFVALLRGELRARISSPEIARLLEVPLLPWITGAALIHGVRGEWRGREIYVPHFELEGCILYGASAFIFHELLQRLAAALGRDLPPPRLQAEVPWGNRYDG